ncbi:MAG: L-histidine N(alpha)-methyltransferase [Candidatus Neomarinimicrobiota bacterium]
MTHLLTITNQTRCTIEALPPVHVSSSLQAAVRKGLTARHKWLPPFLLYDRNGSNLFEEICRLPEYYLTRTEYGILSSHALEMVTHCRRDLDLVELGSGSSAKTRILLDTLFASGRQPIYRPIDISGNMLRSTAQSLLAEYPDLSIRAIVSDYDRGLLETGRRQRRQKVFLFLGSNLGNFTREESLAFLSAVRGGMAADDLFLLGVDLVKPLDVLLPAYDDTAGVTAAFNRNLLRRLNRELGADFRPERYRHVVRWNRAAKAVEMHLVSIGEQTVRLPAIDLEVLIRNGESIHTESSHKYSPTSLAALCAEAGLIVADSWNDPRNWFALSLIKPG